MLTRILVFNANDYEQKYPEDAYGEELGPNARLYRVYLDESGKYNMEMVDSWRDDLDLLLVFVSTRLSPRIAVYWRPIGGFILGGRDDHSS